MEGRIDLYDYAKGIGIILLTFGHVFIYGNIPFSIIFAFHMPLFFIISGMLFRPNSNCGNFVKYKSILYFYPFLFFNLIGVFIWLLRLYNGDYSVYSLVKTTIVEFVLHWGIDTNYMGNMWFLLILFLSVVFINYFCHKKEVTNMGG